VLARTRGERRSSHDRQGILTSRRPAMRSFPVGRPGSWRQGRNGIRVRRDGGESRTGRGCPTRIDNRLTRRAGTSVSVVARGMWAGLAYVAAGVLNGWRPASRGWRRRAGREVFEDGQGRAWQLFVNRRALGSPADCSSGGVADDPYHVARGRGGRNRRRPGSISSPGVGSVEPRAGVVVARLHTASGAALADVLRNGHAAGTSYWTPSRGTPKGPDRHSSARPRDHRLGSRQRGKTMTIHDIVLLVPRGLIDHRGAVHVADLGATSAAVVVSSYGDHPRTRAGRSRGRRP
jgi:hypothetical protein